MKSLYLIYAVFSLVVTILSCTRFVESNKANRGWPLFWMWVNSVASFSGFCFSGDALKSEDPKVIRQLGYFMLKSVFIQLSADSTMLVNLDHLHLEFTGIAEKNAFVVANCSVFICLLIFLVYQLFAAIVIIRASRAKEIATRIV